MEVLYIRIEELIEKYVYSDDIVLDVGCGTGINTSKLRLKTEKIYGLDIKDFTKNEYRGKFSFIKGNGAQIPFKDNYFDCVTCWDVLEHIKNDKQFIKEMIRVLKPRGILMLSTPNRDRLSNRIIKLFKKIEYPYYLGTNPQAVGDIWHVREYIISELEDIVKKAKLQIILSEGIYLGFHGFIKKGFYKVPKIFYGLTQHIFMVLLKE